MKKTVSDYRSHKNRGTHKLPGNGKPVDEDVISKFRPHKPYDGVSNPLNWKDEKVRDYFFELASIQCTHDEAAACLRVDRVTFSRFLAKNQEARDMWDTGQREGRMSLRRAQYHYALGGNTALLIFLGKNWLGQQDVLRQDINAKVEHTGSTEELHGILDAMTKRLAKPEPKMIEAEVTPVDK